MIPESSWEVFDICDICGTGEGQPCCNLQKSTSKNLVKNTTPHRGRKMKNDSATVRWN